MKNENILPIPQIMIIMGLVIAEAYLAYSYVAEKNIEGALMMDTQGSGAIAIFVALIGVAGGIWAQFVQFKRDSGKVGEVKSDTSEMKPDVKNINENVKKVRDEVVEKVVPNLGKLEGITTLVDAYKVEQAIKERQSPNLTDQDILIGSIKLIYDENSKLMDNYRRALQKINQLELEKMALEKQLHEYKSKEQDQER
ncbi:hypothetical protein [Tepidanaerobacter acetatoxydans]|uniref:hypothetical protein n=1 Tax=Tepidanaerobacter acetatoxydans TaxID=499229 RepID=UPI00235B5C03|nr:hypothetical protein [Tepidanaerobacter acetatoxydans]